MHIKIVGLPSAKINRTLVNAQAAATEFEQRPKVHVVSDIEKILAMGAALTTPAILVNDKLKLSSGRIPSVHEIKTWIEEELEEEIAA